MDLLSSQLSSMTAFQTATLLVLLPAALYIVYDKYQLRKRSRGHPLPPGPTGWPIIGNALDIPLKGMAPVYAEWSMRTGSDIVSASALGTTMVVIHSYDTAIELLEKRAAKPISVMARELMGWDSVFALNPYSEEWRAQRKLFVQFFRSPGSAGPGVHTPQVYEFVNRFLVELNETPSDVFGLARHMVGSMAISLAYGLPVQRRRDELVEFIDTIARKLSEQVTPGKAIVDIIPWLRHLPEWLPGMGFKRYAKSVRWMAVKFKMEAYNRATKAFGTDRVRPSFLSNALTSLDGKALSGAEREKELDAIQSVASTIFGTAEDTTTAAILILIFALGTHPKIRKRVQDELDSLLVDHDRESGDRHLRLPTFEDQARLPTLMASVMESLRWVPVFPIGVPHRTTEDDAYNGYFIPKGAIVIANQWSMLNNEGDYGADVLDYNPDRFLRQKSAGKSDVELNPDVRHPATIVFGFGRRICPGSHVAQSTLWLMAACLLTLFEFEIPASERANYINRSGEVDEHFDPGLLCHPRKFGCEFKLRSEEARELMGELSMGV